MEDSHELYEYCVKNGWYEGDYDTWLDNGEELAFFEGDPDMIKVNGKEGYFAKCGDTVFYWLDDTCHDGEMMLKKFFSTYKTGVTIGCESYACGKNPEGVEETEKYWDEIETGIAFRGGAGYSYWVTDWSLWLENENKKPVEKLHEEYFTA